MSPHRSILVFDPPAPFVNLVEVQPGFYILPSDPDDSSLAAVKPTGITHVINLRRINEETPAHKSDSNPSDSLLQAYKPSFEELDLFRAMISALPPSARVLVHCATGNCAAGALFIHFVLDKGLPDREALILARKAGLKDPATETAVMAYLAAQRTPSLYDLYMPEVSE